MEINVELEFNHLNVLSIAIQLGSDGGLHSQRLLNHFVENDASGGGEYVLG